jgi:hypothetical protein
MKKFIEEHRDEIAMVGYVAGMVAVCVAVEKLKGPRLRKFKPHHISVQLDKGKACVVMIDKKHSISRGIRLSNDDARAMAAELEALVRAIESVPDIPEALNIAKEMAA